MLLFQRHLLFLSLPRLATTPLPSRHRCLLSLTTPAAASSFAVEDYLVTACHLSPAQALKASKHLAHLKSPSKPDAVLAFLSGLGLSPADIAATVAADPRLLCAEVDKTVAPRVADLLDLGLSRSQVAGLVLADPARFRRPTIVAKLQFYIPLFGSFDSFLEALRNNAYLLSTNLEKVVEPNVAILHECGLGARDIAKVCQPVPRLLTTNPERVRAMVACAEKLGVPRGTPMFRYALVAVAYSSPQKIAAKLEFMKRTLGWSDKDTYIAVSKLPVLLRNSKEKLRRVSEFLISEVGLEPEYIAHRPVFLTYSLERRLMPRHYVLKFLKAKGLMESDRNFYTAVQVNEKAFLEKYVRPYEDIVRGLAEDYAAACRGEVPARFTL